MSDLIGRLDAIQERLDAATPGPWEYGHHWDAWEWIKDGVGGRKFRPASDTSYEWIPSPRDAIFIASTPEDIEFLLDLARKQQAALEAVKALHCVQPPRRGDVIGPYCSECTSPIDGGPELWPCPTIRALDGDDA